MRKDAILIKYRTRQDYCSCCDQELPSPKISDEKTFGISKESAMSWADWESTAEHPEDIEGMVYEFTYEIIRFYAVDSSQRIIIDDSEVERVKDFILQVVIDGRTAIESNE